MYRRLMAWSMAIAAVGALAFVIPLAINVRQYQRDIAMVRATQEAREVASYAVAINDSSRLTNVLRNLGYGEGPNRVTVWYPDGRAIVASMDNATVGPMPEEAQRMVDSSVELRSFSRAVSGGQQLLMPQATSNGPVVVAVDVPSSELNKGVLVKWAWLGILGLAIVLAAGVVAGRCGRFITPPAMPTREAQPVG